MSELSFLISLILNDKLPIELKQLIADRIKEVEEKMLRPTIVTHSNMHIYKAPIQTSLGPVQSASTQHILDEMAAEGAPLPVPAAPVTAAAHQALASRSQAVAMAAKGVADPMTGRPRKF